jgi:hypothetical protein
LAFNNVGKSFAKDAKNIFYLKVGGARYQVSFGVDVEKYKKQRGIDMAPSAPNFITAVSRPGIRRDYFNQLLNESNVLGIRIDFSYGDAYSEHYEESHCIERLATGAMANAEPDKCEIEQ